MSFSHTENIQAKQMRPWREITFKLLLSLLFLIIGIGLLGFCTITTHDYNKKSKAYTETMSTVVDYDHNREGLYAIIVEYVVDNQSYRKISNTYSRNPEPAGTQISIKYNPDNPKDAIWSKYSPDIIFLFLGAIATLMGTFTLINMIKNMKADTPNNSSAIEQSNGLFDRADVIDSMSDNRNNTNSNL